MRKFEIMSDGCCAERSKGGIISLVLTMVTFVAFFAVLIAGITIVATPYDFENLPYFSIIQCTPIAVSIIYMPLCDEVNDGDGGIYHYDEYAAIWQCKETGATIMENPFAGNRQRQIAENSMDDFPLNQIQNVSCNTKNLPAQYPDWTNFFQCQVWNTCFFDTDMIEDLQANSLNRYQRGFHLLYASAGIGALCLVSFIVFIVDMMGYCKKDYNSI